MKRVKVKNCCLNIRIQSFSSSSHATILEIFFRNSFEVWFCKGIFSHVFYLRAKWPTKNQYDFWIGKEVFLQKSGFLTSTRFYNTMMLKSTIFEIFIKSRNCQLISVTVTISYMLTTLPDTCVTSAKPYSYPRVRFVTWRWMSDNLISNNRHWND